MFQLIFQELGFPVNINNNNDEDDNVYNVIQLDNLVVMIFCCLGQGKIELKVSLTIHLM